MKNIGIAYTIALIMLIACVVSIGTCVSQKKAHSNENNVVNEAINDTPSWYRDREGREHVQAQVVDGSLTDIQLVRKMIIDSVTRALHIKANQLKEVNILSVKTSGSVPLTLDSVINDSGQTKELGISYHNGWINIDGVIGKDSKMTYDVYDSLILTTYMKKRGWFKSPLLYADAYSLNPHTHIAGLSGIKIESSKPKKWGLGVGIGYGFNGTKFEPMIGVSINYLLIRL